VPVGDALRRGGAEGLCVATLDEALELRRGGVGGPLLVLFPVPVERLDTVARRRIAIGVASEEGAAAAVEAAGRRPDRAPIAVHLEIETGLARCGIAPERAAAVAAAVAATPGLRLAGIWSHLASAHDAAMSAAQVERFGHAVAAVASAGLPVPPRHLAASGGLLAGRTPTYEIVRPGLAIYGCLPDELPLAPAAVRVAAALRPALALKARAIRLDEIPAGTPVGYSGRWVAPRPSRIATLPVGYGDGLARSYGMRDGALVHGRRVPLIGTVAMDAVMADVTDVPGVSTEDEFVLLGRQGDEEIDAAELARARTTISYEVLATMARRLPRVYHAGRTTVGYRTLTEEGGTWRGSSSGTATSVTSRSTPS